MIYFIAINVPNKDLIFVFTKVFFCVLFDWEDAMPKKNRREVRLFIPKPGKGTGHLQKILEALKEDMTAQEFRKLLWKSMEMDEECVELYGSPVEFDEWS